jgi:hypothetical protein
MLNPVFYGITSALGWCYIGWCLHGFVKGWARRRTLRRMSGPITIPVTKREPIDVTLGDKKYKVIPPKAAFAMKLAIQNKVFQDDPTQMLGLLDEWMKKAFGTKYAAIQKRLDDDADELDITHIMQLLEQMMEVQADPDPTT